MSLGETVWSYDATIISREEVISVKATTERRLAIREFISWKRHTSIPELMKAFAVSKEDETFLRMVFEERLSSRVENERMERIFAAYVRSRKCG